MFVKGAKLFDKWKGQSHKIIKLNKVVQENIIFLRKNLIANFRRIKLTHSGFGMFILYLNKWTIFLSFYKVHDRLGLIYT